MWSGPRNLSTALMYAFGARADTSVWDEPFYAAYLAATGLDHPMREEILAAGETDPGKVAEALTGEGPGGRAHFYQKHMAHHMIPGFPLEWMAEVTHVFLVRHPARVVASYVRKRERPTLEDLGFQQQLALYERALGLGQQPVVIDSAAIRAEPEAALRRLCAALGLSFEPGMLHWPAGGHENDGVWARHWYGAVHRSTGFDGPESPIPDLPAPYAALAEAALPAYEQLSALSL